MRRVYFLSESTRTNIKAACVEHLRTWRDSWCFSALEVTVSVFKSNGEDPSDLPCYVSQSKPNSFFFLDDLGVDWKRLIFNEYINDVPSDDIADSLVEQAKLALVQTLQKILFLSEVNQIAMGNMYFPTSSQQPGDGLAVIEFAIGSAEFKIHVPVDDWIEKYIDSLSINKQPLIPASSMVGQNEVTIEVELELGSYNIGLIKNLAVGDVMISDISVETPFNITLSQKPVAKAFLGKDGPQKAIYLQPKTTV